MIWKINFNYIINIALFFTFKILLTKARPSYPNVVSREWDGVESAIQSLQCVGKTAADISLSSASSLNIIQFIEDINLKFQLQLQ